MARQQRILTERLTGPAARDASDAVSLSFFGTVPETWMRNVAVQAPFAGLALVVRPVPRTPMTDGFIAPVPVAVPRSLRESVRRARAVVAERVVLLRDRRVGPVGQVHGCVDGERAARRRAWDLQRLNEGQRVRSVTGCIGDGKAASRFASVAAVSRGRTVTRGSDSGSVDGAATPADVVVAPL